MTPGQLSGLRVIQTIANWYRLEESVAIRVGSAAQSFIENLLEHVQPAAVLSWQSAHPASRITRLACESRDIPWWCAERGWLRDTLMVDLCENNALSEAARSLGLRRAFAGYRMDERLPGRLRHRLEVTGVGQPISG
jgi:hypothetical protein